MHFCLIFLCDVRCIVTLNITQKIIQNAFLSKKYFVMFGVIIQDADLCEEPHRSDNLPQGTAIRYLANCEGKNSGRGIPCL
jgi:hypothetical protein